MKNKAMIKNKSIETLKAELNKATDNSVKQSLHADLMSHPKAALDDYLNFAIFLRDIDAAESLKILDDAQNKFGENAWIEDNRARVYRILKKFSQALSCWEKAGLIAEEKDKQFFVNELSSVSEEEEPSVQIFKTEPVVETEKNNSEESLVTLRANIEKSLDNAEKTQCYDVLLNHPDVILADYLNFAIFLRNSDATESLKIIDDAQSKFGDNAWIEDNRARAYRILNKLPDAISCWEKASAIVNDENSKKFFADELSRTFETFNKHITEQISDAKKNNKWDEVISILNSYKLHQTKNLYLYLELCIAYRNKKDYANAIDILKAAEKQDLKSPWLHDNYARIFFNIGQYKKSIRAALVALKEARNDSERGVFIDLLETLKERLAVEHQNGKYLNIFPIDVPVLLVQLFDDKKQPTEIHLDIYDDVSSEQCEMAFQSLNDVNDFSEASQDVNKLLVYYLPQFLPVLEASNDLLTSNLTATAKPVKSSSFASAQTASPEEVDKNTAILNDFSSYSVADRNRLVEIILKSGLFNHVFYAQQIELVFGIAEAVEHYLLNGAVLKLSPIPNFNPQDYRELNLDIPELSDAECFVHYVLAGRAEKRYFNRTLLRRDAAILRTYPRFDSLWYAFFAKEILGDWDAHEHYLAMGWRKNFLPNRHSTFDSNIYLKYYLDARQSETPPFLHYLILGANRFASMADINLHFSSPILQSGEFDTDFYQIRCNDKNITDTNAAVLHYVFNGGELKLDPNENFSTEYYSKRYPDLKQSAQMPFIHYLNHGRKEGRVASFVPQQYIQPGRSTFDPNKPTIVVVCHEASRSGAPILGLRLMELLSYRANIICWLGRGGGAIANDFVECSIAVINNPVEHVDAVWVIRELRKRFLLQVAILNSVATAAISAAFYEEKIPILALVHEYSDYMSQDVAQMLFAANRIVFPAQGVKASAEITSTKCFGMIRSNTVVQHQGRCIPPTGDDEKTYAREDILLKMGVSEDDTMPAIVLGCGAVQIRKGVEYFIEAARYCKKLLDKPIHFIWVGGGYNPDADLHYSAWLKSQLLNSDLEDDVTFFAETDDLTPFFELADAFFLSSRLDPFPNVALDAVDAGVPVVAFERATGFADFIHDNPTVGATVPFLDVNAAAAVLCDYVTGKRLRADNDEKIAKQLSFSSYVDFIWNECEIAIEQQKQINTESQLLVKSRLLNRDFYTSATPNWQSIMSPEYVYVAMWARGIATAKSRVGFNDMAAQATLSVESKENKAITPLAALINTKIAPLSHKTLYINPDENSEKWTGKLSVALHIHAHYTEALPGLLKRFSTLGQNITFCITTDTDEKAKIIMGIAKKLPLKINTIVMPNRGRDVGPFIMAMKEHLSQFEVVGHFHLKGTKQLEQTVVRQWQDFLYNTLIGQHGEIANILLHQLEQNPKLGLLFQEDPCLPNWSKNRELADKLLTKLEITRQTPDIIEYPTGNMFWVRTAALAPLLKHDWQWHDFPAEPVPYDGSGLHAIERLTPIICEEAGYEWATVHNPLAKRYS
jgi:tetratricopeptide (TPR) repeat protein